MNHVLKIDERAFNEGVREVLKFRPLVRAVKAAVSDKKTQQKQKQEKETAAVRERS